MLDDDHRMQRGLRYAVCDKTLQLYKREPYNGCFAFIEPLNEITLERATAFDCSRPHLRHPKETKGQDYDATTAPSACCDDGAGSSCC